MATQISKIALALEMIEGAEASIRSAKQILYEVVGDPSLAKKRKMEEALEDLSSPSELGNEKIIEGVFDGEKMIGADKRTYVVPANYASKSKLVAGDILKLTILEDGRLMYKIIGPIEKKHIMGTLTYDDGKYKVIAEGKLFNVLLASVTYFKGEVGDKVSLIVPQIQDTDWGAIEAIIPQSEVDIVEEHDPA